MEPSAAHQLFRPGDHVVFREVWRDQAWSTWVVIVVADGGGRTIVYRPIGMPGMVPVNENGPFRRTESGHWFEPRSWQGRHALCIHEWSETCSIWCMWDEHWQHRGWYVNLELPWSRASGAIETMDHELDIVIAPDRSWQWKDEDRLAEWVAGGAHTAAEAAEFRAAGERVIAERVEPWTAPFDEGWETWRPDPAWELPRLPDTWRSRGKRAGTDRHRFARPPSPSMAHRPQDSAARPFSGRRTR